MKRTSLSLSSLLLGSVSIPLIAVSGTAGAQELSLGAYGSVDYRVIHTVPVGAPSVTENGFSIPTLDIFLRGSAGKWSFLSEVLLDIDQGNSFSVDADRLQVTYDHASWLKVTAGRFHTSIGYYNTAYPHGGAIYLLPVDRPALVDQHDAESLLPTSTVGLNVHGSVPVSTSMFSYDVDLANGRGASSDEVANGEDLNQEKMVNVRLRCEISDLVIGANALVDWIPPRAVPPLQPETLREQIFGAHVAYVEHPWHLIVEGAAIQHVAAATTYTTLAGLAEFGYTVNQVTPYARLELARFPALLDPFWAATPQQARGNYQAVSAGAKWMPNDSIALKIELEWNHATTDTFYQAATQLAFGF